ncbi:hypothetical protein ABZX51_003846 [Aspergillus tubingensis]
MPEKLYLLRSGLESFVFVAVQVNLTVARLLYFLGLGWYPDQQHDEPDRVVETQAQLSVPPEHEHTYCGQKHAAWPSAWFEISLLWIDTILPSGPLTGDTG